MFTNVVVAGNPGTGKSTILNTIVRSIRFPSGPSPDGDGVTRTMNSVEYNGTRYTDTPGLDDVGHRETASAEIQRALNLHDRIKLIFVITLESGRLRGNDISTIKTVLDSLKSNNVDTDGNYSIIVNKVSKKAMDRASSNPHFKNNISRKIGDGIGGSPAQIIYLPEDDALDEERNMMMSFDSRMKLDDFISKAPLIVSRGGHFTVDTSNYAADLIKIAALLKIASEPSCRMA